MTPAAYLMYWNRPDFRGLNDKYLERGSRYGITPISGVQAAIAGDAVYDAIGGAFTDTYRDLCSQRLSRYRYQWRFYEGFHYDQPYEDGERKTVQNFCKLIVDKSISFFMAEGWEVKAVEGNEQVAEILNETWNANNRAALTHRILQYGSINGDCFIYVSVNTKDKHGNPLNKSDWTVKLVSFNPKYCYPFFSKGDPNKIESIMIQFPTYSVDDPNTNVLYTVYIKADKIQVWHNDEKIDEQDNPFGEVNIVHYKNCELANSAFGVGDIDDVIAMNEEYNLTANSIRRTIKYHGEPTTVIFGARASDMERGAKKVWSNLPKDARVENLKLDGDLKAAMDYLKELEGQIYKVGGIPKIALESADQMRISNTSAVAIAMLYQPLVEKTNTKRVGFSQMVKDVDRLILIAERDIIGTDVSALADDIDELFETYPEYTSPLPRDMTAEITNGIQLIDKGVWSRAEMARRLAGVPDFERLALEITADQQAELINAYESQRAAMGIRPNTLASFLGSMNLSEDLSGVANEVAGLLKKKSNSTPIKKPKNRVLTAQ